MRQEETQDEGHTEEAGGGGGNTGTLRAARGPQKLGEARGRSFLEASEGTWPRWYSESEVLPPELRCL